VRVAPDKKALVIRKNYLGKLAEVTRERDQARRYNEGAEQRADRAEAQFGQLEAVAVEVRDNLLQAVGNDEDNVFDTALASFDKLNNVLLVFGP
jgi:hypothetical protein